MIIVETSGTAGEFAPLLQKLTKIAKEDIKAIETELDKINANWTPGRVPSL